MTVERGKVAKNSTNLIVFGIIRNLICKFFFPANPAFRIITSLPSTSCDDGGLSDKSVLALFSQPLDLQTCVAA